MRRTRWLLGKNSKRSCWSNLGQPRQMTLMKLCPEYVKMGHLGSTNGSLKGLLIVLMVGHKRHWWGHLWVD